MRIRYQIILL